MLIKTLASAHHAALAPLFAAALLGVWAAERFSRVQFTPQELQNWLGVDQCSR